MDPKQIVFALVLLGGAFWFLTTSEKTPIDETAGLTTADSARGITFGGPIQLGASPMGNAQHDPNDDVQRHARTAQRGWQVDGYAAIGAQDQIFHVADIVTGIPPYDQREGARARDLYPLPAPRDCAFRAPRTGEKLVNVNIESADGPKTGIHIFSEAALIGRTHSWIERTLHANDGAMADLADFRIDGALRELNVVLTDSSAPLYLVLQSMGGRVLWNLHPADGVQIAHIAVISGGSSAINPPEDGTFEIEMINARAAACAAIPMQKPRDHWGFIAQQSTLSLNVEDELKRAHASYQRYNDFFAPRFGQPAEQDAIGGTSQSFVLVGDPPAEGAAKPVFRAASGARLYATDDAYLFNAPDDERDAFVASQQLALAQMALGADLANLIPAPIETPELALAANGAPAPAQIPAEAAQ